MNDTAIDKAKLKKIIFITLGAIVVLFAILFFINNAFVIVNVSGATDSGAVKVSVIQNGKGTPAGSGGLMLIPRGTQALLVTSGDNSSLAPVTVPFIGIASVAVRLEDSQDAKQAPYAGTAPTCATYSGKELLQYDCAKPTELLKYDTSTSKNQKVASLAYIENQILPPYMNGVIGFDEKQIEASANPTLGESHVVAVVATDSNGRTSYDAPDGISRDGLLGIRIFTDSKDTTNAHFVLVDAFGAIYLATPSDDKKAVSYKRIEAPDDYNYRFNHTLCAVDGDAVTCYRGRTSATPEDDATYAMPSVSTLSFADGEIATKGAPTIEYLNNFYSVSGKLYGKIGGTLMTITLESDKYAFHEFAWGVGSVAAGSGLSFTYDNRVFELDGDTLQAHQTANAKDSVIKGLYPVDDKTFVFGSPKDSDDVRAYEF